MSFDLLKVLEKAEKADKKANAEHHRTMLHTALENFFNGTRDENKPLVEVEKAFTFTVRDTDVVASTAEGTPVHFRILRPRPNNFMQPPLQVAVSFPASRNSLAGEKRDETPPEVLPGWVKISSPSELSTLTLSKEPAPE